MSFLSFFIARLTVKVEEMYTSTVVTVGRTPHKLYRGGRHLRSRDHHVTSHNHNHNHSHNHSHNHNHNHNHNHKHYACLPPPIHSTPTS